MTRPTAPALTPAAADPPLRLLARAGARAGLAGGLVFAGWVALCGEIANDTTTVGGVRSSTWTAVSAVAAFAFGSGAFHGDFSAGGALGGLAVVLAVAVVVALPGAALISYTFAGRPDPLGGALAGLAYGLAVQVVLVNLLVNGIESPNRLYGSIPAWGWWAGHALYGATLGLVLAHRLGREGR